MTYDELIKQIDKEINSCNLKQGANKIENSNFIIVMLLRDIKEGKLNSIVDVAEWCFEKLKLNRELNYLLTKESIGDIIKEKKE